MKPNQECKTEPHKKTPVEFLLPSSLKATHDPVPFNENKMINVGNKGGDELEHVTVDNAATDEKHAKIIPNMEDVENLNAAMSQTWSIIESSSENAVPQIKKTFHKEKFKTDGGNVETLYQNGSNNNYIENAFLSESKAAYAEKLLYGSKNSNWKRGRVGLGSGDSEDFLLPSPWKRVAYVAMLLMVGISCAVLAVMKVFGGADWMNTATFSVIIMGSLLLLPPGLYYGQIVICVTCGCKGYSFWDVPQGPFD